MRRNLRVLALTRYGELGASSRLRTFQYLPDWYQSDIDVTVIPLFEDEILSARYKIGRYGLLTIMQCFSKRIAAMLFRKNIDLIWIEKEALPWWPLWFELILLRGTPFILDYDDATFHNYDKHRSALVRWIYSSRLDKLMNRSSLVLGGSPYLVERAKKSGAKKIELLPTVIDLKRYPINKIKKSVSEIPRIVWIGSPSTAQYLNILHEPLKKLVAKKHFILRIIGADIHLPGVPIELINWTEESEVSNIAECDIGIMPLRDSAWEKGKCGYKLIQYMACHLPVVASPVGVNTSIVENGINGYLANDAEEWVRALLQLIENKLLCEKMGAAGRLKVEAEYSLQVSSKKLINLILNLVE